MASTSSSFEKDEEPVDRSGADFAAKRGYLFTGDGEAASRFEQEDGAPEYYPMSPSVGSPVEGGWMGFSCRSL